MQWCDTGVYSFIHDVITFFLSLIIVKLTFAKYVREQTYRMQ